MLMSVVEEKKRAPRIEWRLLRLEKKKDDDWVLVTIFRSAESRTAGILAQTWYAYV